VGWYAGMVYMMHCTMNGNKLLHCKKGSIAVLQGEIDLNQELNFGPVRNVAPDRSLFDAPKLTASRRALPKTQLKIVLELGRFAKRSQLLRRMVSARDAVLAEGAAAETYAGEDHYGFDNAEEYERLYGSNVGPKRSFAPVVAYYGRRRELISRVRSAVSPLYDARQPLDRIRDHIASRAELSIAA
jgi:hypothetical protein